MIDRLRRYFPVGMDIEHELRRMLVLLMLSAVSSLSFFVMYYARYSSLFEKALVNGKIVSVLRRGAVMPDFAQFAPSCLILFPIAAALLLIIGLSYYRYHFIGSKSIYLMRRLPDGSELGRRCITAPLTAACMLMILAALLLALYFLFYMLVTPDKCLAPHQLTKLIHSFFGGAL